MATSGAPLWRPVEPHAGICEFFSFSGFSRDKVIDSASGDVPNDSRVVTDTWKVFQGSLSTIFILIMTPSDAYLMMWENPNFANNPEISFILKEICWCEKTQVFSHIFIKLQNALKLRLSIQFRWDRSMTELKVTSFEPTKKVGFGDRWSCNLSTTGTNHPKNREISGFWGFCTIFRIRLQNSPFQGCGKAFWSLNTRHTSISGDLDT